LSQFFFCREQIHINCGGMNSILRTSPFVASHTGGNEQIHVNARAGLLVLFKSVTVYNRKKLLPLINLSFFFILKRKKTYLLFLGSVVICSMNVSHPIGGLMITHIHNLTERPCFSVGAVKPTKGIYREYSFHADYYYSLANTVKGNKSP
jgi:hypothetical protein